MIESQLSAVNLLTLSCQALKSSHTFGPEGGTFGRSEQCDWVLPDNERILSAVHGRVISIKDDYVLIDQSTNGTFVGGSRPIGRGGSVLLQDGMSLSVGHYSIEIRLKPDFELLDDPSLPYLNAASNALVQSSAPDIACTRSATVNLRSSEDPLVHLNTRPDLLEQAPSSDPSSIVVEPLSQHFAELPEALVRSDSAHVSPETVKPVSQRSMSTQIPKNEIIPEDFLEEFSVGLPAAAQPQQPPAKGGVQVVVDAPLSPALPQVSVRPMHPEIGGSSSGADSQSNGVELVTAQSSVSRGNSTDGKTGAKRSPDPLKKLKSASGRSSHAGIPTAATVDSVETGPVTERGSRKKKKKQPPSAAAGDGDVEARQLVQALMKGLGLDVANPPMADCEELLHSVGAMVRNTAVGLTTLLAARKLVESAFRLDDTQVQPEERNPFKGLKVGELALDEMLLTKSGGYQPPAEATKEAFSDIQYFTLITVSAMNRSLKLLFERLNPDNLEQNEACSSAETSTPGFDTHNSRWQVYEENYQKMQENFDMIVHQITAEAFNQAQEERARKDAKKHHKSGKKDDSKT
jgi:type VI secretion system FHA domain protein